MRYIGLIVFLFCLASPAMAARYGSGFIIHPGASAIVVTNYHVVSKCVSPYVDIDGGRAATVVAVDAINDLAALRVALPDRPAASLRSTSMALGEDAYASGYPLASYLSRAVKLTRGIISSLAGQTNDPRFYQIDAAVQPGNSGGPLTDRAGLVGGVITARLDSSKMMEIGLMAENVNFALKGEVLRRFVEKVQIPVQYDRASAATIADYTVPIGCESLSDTMVAAHDVADEQNYVMLWDRYGDGKGAARFNPGGQIAIELADIGRCVGRAEPLKGEVGVWSFACPKDVTAKGSYTQQGKVTYVVGADQRGNEVTFCIGADIADCIAAPAATATKAEHCAPPMTTVQEIICADSHLQSLDERVTSLTDRAGDKVSLRQYQNWLMTRDECENAEAVEACIESMTERRLDYLHDILADRTWRLEQLDGGLQLAYTGTDYGTVGVFCSKSQVILMATAPKMTGESVQIALSVDGRQLLNRKNDMHTYPKDDQEQIGYGLIIDAVALAWLRNGRQGEITFNGRRNATFGLSGSAEMITDACR